MVCMPKRIRIAILLGLAIGGIGCTSDSGPDTSSGGTTEHPITDRVPYHEQAVPVTQKQTLANLSNPPDVLQTLATVLDDQRSVDTTRLDVLVEESRGIDIISSSPNRLILLVGNPENRMYEFDLQDGTATQIASKGSGPGQLKFAQDITRGDSAIFVAQGDRQIDEFDCRTIPCTYEESTRLRFSPMAVAAARSHHAVVGSPMLRREGMKMEDWSGAVQMLDADGSIRQSFGRTYQANHFMVLSAYLRNSSLIYSDTLDQFVRASEDLPFIWTYKANGSLEFVWSIHTFDPLPIRYFPSEQRRHKEFQEGFSTLHLQGPIDGRFVIATVRHLGFSSKDSDLTLTGVDYYALDLRTDETYYLGRDTPRKGIADRLFLVTNEHQILVENGTVALIRPT